MNITIPQGVRFVDEDGLEVDFLDDDAGELQYLANAIFEKHGLLFKHLADASISYLWKREGGSGGGKATLGKCIKMSGLARHYAKCDFTIWLAADHCRDLQFDALQLEALLFHELLHIGVEVNKDGQTKLVIQPHDLEVFLAEIQAYGCWTSDLKRLRQLPMFQAPAAATDAPPAEPASLAAHRVVKEAAARINAGELGPGVTASLSEAASPTAQASSAISEHESSDFAVGNEDRSGAAGGAPHTHWHGGGDVKPAVCHDADCAIEPRYPVEADQREAVPV